jgi:hypothetical protein
MMHFSCDLCGKDLLNKSPAHYVVKMEVFAAHDPSELTEDDLDIDHLEEIGQLLTEDGPEAEPTPAFKKLRYDLCSSCHARFLADPLGRELQKFQFSAN